MRLDTLVLYDKTVAQIQRKNLVKLRRKRESHGIAGLLDSAHFISLNNITVSGFIYFVYPFYVSSYFSLSLSDFVRDGRFLIFTGKFGLSNMIWITPHGKMNEQSHVRLDLVEYSSAFATANNSALD